MSALMAQLAAVTASARTIEQQVLDILAEAKAPLEIVDIRVRLVGRLVDRTELHQVLDGLINDGKVIQRIDGSGRRNPVAVFLLRARADEFDEPAPVQQPKKLAQVQLQAGKNAEIVYTKIRELQGQARRRDLVRSIDSLTASQIDGSIQYLVLRRKVRRLETRHLVAVEPQS